LTVTLPWSIFGPSSHSRIEYLVSKWTPRAVLSLDQTIASAVVACVTARMVSVTARSTERRRVRERVKARAAATYESGVLEGSASFFSDVAVAAPFQVCGWCEFYINNHFGILSRGQFKRSERLRAFFVVICPANEQTTRAQWCYA